MKIFREMLVFFTCLFFLSFVSEGYVFAHAIEVGSSTEYSGGTPVFIVQCCSLENAETVELDGAMGHYMIHCESFGRYSVGGAFLCSDEMLCRIVEHSASSYSITLESCLQGGWRDWHIEKPQGCSYWEVTPQGQSDPYQRKVYIRKISNIDAWRIEKESIVAGNSLIEEIAIINFDERAFGEIIDLVNFLFVVVNHAAVCSAEYWS